MSPDRWTAILILLSAPFAVAAQEVARTSDPADPAAAIAPARYESAFCNYRPLAETDESPAQAWRAANDEVGRLGGHQGHMAATGTKVENAGRASSGQAGRGMDHQDKGK